MSFLSSLLPSCIYPKEAKFQLEEKTKQDIVKITSEISKSLRSVKNSCVRPNQSRVDIFNKLSHYNNKISKMVNGNDCSIAKFIRNIEKLERNANFLNGCIHPLGMQRTHQIVKNVGVINEKINSDYNYKCLTTIRTTSSLGRPLTPKG